MTQSGSSAGGRCAYCVSDHGRLRHGNGGAQRYGVDSGVQYPNARQMIANLLADHETIIRQLRMDLETAERHHDMGTNDFLTGLIEKHEQTAWMLRAFFAGESV
jgi:Ferritin-like domain